VTDTPVGRVGGLICWENRMPLARWAVYQGGPQIWVAPTADDSDGWLASMRHIAIESGAFVVSVPQYIPGSAFPDDFRRRWTGRRSTGAVALRSSSRRAAK
jgi:nitrilase